MTHAQIMLLRKLIESDRQYHSKRAEHIVVSYDDRGVEIGYINGVDPRTAKALVEAELAEILDLPGKRNPYIFLGKYSPYDEIEEY